MEVYQLIGANLIIIIIIPFVLFFLIKKSKNKLIL